MSRSKDREMCAAIADALLADLTLKDSQLSGSDTKWAGPMPIEWEIVASIVWRPVAAVLIKMRGNLYMMFVYDDRKYTLSAFVIDGSKVGFNEELRATGKIDLWNRGWSRKEAFERIHPGLVTSFARDRIASTWTEYPHSKSLMAGYLLKRNKDPMVSSDQCMHDAELGF